MDLYEAVHVRKSIRSYRKKPVEESMKERILCFALHLFSLDGQNVEYRIVEREQLKKQPGLFSPQAPCYLTIYAQVCDGYEENAGYLMQQVALYLNTKGLGCCFVGNPVYEEEISGMVPVVSLAFGWPKAKNMYRDEEKVDRLSMKTLCTIKEEPAPEVMEVLRAARLAPSSLNSQPWRFVVYQNRVHIFCRCKRTGIAGKKRRELQEIGRQNRVDMGIMLANLLLISEELWLETELRRLENIAEQEVGNHRYFVTVRFL